MLITIIILIINLEIYNFCVFEFNMCRSMKYSKKLEILINKKNEYKLVKGFFSKMEFSNDMSAFS